MQRNDPIEQRQHRAAHLIDRAKRKPLGSNGRQKDEATAQRLITEAAVLTATRNALTAEAKPETR